MNGRGRRVSLVGAVVVVVAALLAFPGAAQQPEPRTPAFQSDKAANARALRLLEAVQQGLPYVPGELLVRFEPGALQRRALSSLNKEVQEEDTRWIGETLHVTNLGDIDVVQAAAALTSQTDVVYAQPNYINHPLSIPNDPGFSQQWHFSAINLPQAWDINTGAGQGVTVAVVDTGLTTIEATYVFQLWTSFGFRLFAVPFEKVSDFDHSRVLRGEDFTPFGGWTDASSGVTLLWDAVGHGSHVAGTIAQQTNNGVGFAGAAHGVTVLPVKACFGPWDVQMDLNARGIPYFAQDDDQNNGCTTDAEVNGIRYAADAGAKVINFSIGGPSASPVLRDALQYAVSKGAFVAISGGNEGDDDNAPSYPAVYASEIAGVMSVAAVGPTLNRAAYSNTGAYVEIAAPGGSGVVSASEQVWQMVPSEEDLRLFPFRSSPAFNRYEAGFSAGTSMASPHVAAVAALLYSQGITNPAAIEAAIKRFARDLGAPGRDDEFGYGLVDARASLRGFGVAR
jgi:serine protease